MAPLKPARLRSRMASAVGSVTMRAGILVAPDSFKGTLSAAKVARAIAEGIRAGGGEAEELPIGDGGEGTMDALVATLGGELRTATVSDPLGRPVKARFALLPDGRAVVETAEASGFRLLSEDRSGEDT